MYFVLFLTLFILFYYFPLRITLSKVLLLIWCHPLPSSSQLCFNTIALSFSFLPHIFLFFLIIIPDSFVSPINCMSQVRHAHHPSDTPLLPLKHPFPLVLKTLLILAPSPPPPEAPSPPEALFYSLTVIKRRKVVRWTYVIA